jgi:anti-sigma factor ChrR (cupin superfamily)
MNKPFSYDLSSLAKVDVDEQALAALAWKDFGTGVRMAKLAREGATGLVLYEIGADAKADAFTPHRHTGGEAYLVLKGTIEDDSGRYGEGQIVWMAPGSTHAPRGVGRTIVLVLWPGGVEGA